MLHSNVVILSSSSYKFLVWHWGISPYKGRVCKGRATFGLHCFEVAATDFSAVRTYYSLFPFLHLDGADVIWTWLLQAAVFDVVVKSKASLVLLLLPLHQREREKKKEGTLYTYDTTPFSSNHSSVVAKRWVNTTTFFWNLLLLASAVQVPSFFCLLLNKRGHGLVSLPTC